MRPSLLCSDIIVIRSGGDIATGVIQAFYRSGFPVVVLETATPTTIRRNVALSEAVYEGAITVEDMTCRTVSTQQAIEHCHRIGEIPLLIDPEGLWISSLAPACVIDAILAKRNTGMHRQLAPCTIGIGPGFSAGDDVDIVIESMRGHNLGRLILAGSAMPNSGTPGLVGGKSAQRVIHSPATGIVRHRKALGDVLSAGEVIGWVGETPFHCPFDGLLRGLIREGLSVRKGLKIADVDPRLDTEWNSISDKARCIGGSALQAFLFHKAAHFGGK